MNVSPECELLIFMGTCECNCCDSVLAGNTALTRDQEESIVALKLIQVFVLSNVTSSSRAPTLLRKCMDFEITSPETMHEFSNEFHYVPIVVMPHYYPQYGHIRGVARKTRPRGRASAF